MHRVGIVCGWLVVVMAVGAVCAEEAAPFKTALNAGLTLTDGNSETMQANASLVTEGERKGLGSVRAGIEAQYGETTVDGEKDTTVNNARGFVNARKTVTPRTFGYLDASVMHDDIADIQYRATVGPGLGVYLVKNDKTALSAEAGPSYVWEKVDGKRDDYLALRFAERFSQVLSPTAKAWQAVEYLPKADDFGDYLLRAEAGIEATLTTRMNLRLVLQDTYDSTPGKDLEKNDLTLIAGVGIKL